jgi:Amt family ammonium transporter
VFATTAVNSGGADGLLGNARSSSSRSSPPWASAWAFAFTYGMLFVINKITPVKVSKAEEAAGLDTALHSEQAYDLDATS